MEQIFKKLCEAISAKKDFQVIEYTGQAAEIVFEYFTEQIEASENKRSAILASLYITETVLSELTSYADTYLDTQEVDETLEKGQKLASQIVYG